MDYRKEENRKEAFINWFGWSVELEDCDSALYMNNYFFDRFEYNIEQRLWITWLYGTTYYWPTAYVIWNEFPDMELVGIERLKDWNDKNYSRLRYQTDTKWNKGHLPDQFISYKNWVNKRTQKEAIESCLSENVHENFHTLWKTVNGWHKFGRYTTWFYLQTLKQCCNINIEPNTLFLEDHSGSLSHRNGLCFAIGKDEWVDKKLSTSELEYIKDSAKELLLETQRRFPHLVDRIDYFSMETCLCSFKKLFRKREGRYLGYYLDRQAEEIKKVEQDGWVGIDWTPMWNARNEKIKKEYLTDGINKSKMEIFLDTGAIDYNNTFTKVKYGLEEFMT
jgi:hypothetical protein